MTAQPHGRRPGAGEEGGVGRPPCGRGYAGAMFMPPVCLVWRITGGTQNWKLCYRPWLGGGEPAAAGGERHERAARPRSDEVTEEDRSRSEHDTR
jgi:hypothetical protein